MKIKIALVMGFIFFVLGVITLPHYGINWDTINHLPRGQAYLHYFLTGKKDYSDLPPYFSGWQTRGQWYWQNPESLLVDLDVPLSKIPRRSLYQNSELDFKYFMRHDGNGHPPLSDILSSVFNVTLYNKLRLINDIDSYRVYGILLSAFLVGLVFFWTAENYGKFAGLIASISLSLFPLFWSESHFNTEKDIPETVYWSFLLFCVYKSIVKKKVSWMLLSGIFFGLALGTKFNILFTAFVILPWIIIYFLSNKKKAYSINNIRLLFSSILAFFTGIVIFVGSWPYLWPDPLTRIAKILNFYKVIGTTASYDSRFLGPFGINTYPIQWIIYTTPLIILFLSLVGIIAVIKNMKNDRNKLSLLFLLWLFTPILRVTLPGMTIYGGVRQIMEFIPALAIFSGLGAYYLWNFLVKKLKLSKSISGVLILICFIPITIRLIQIHPYENVYFNLLIGGLKGAKEQDFPAWGNTFGAAYRKAAIWINKNAEKNANLVYAYELIPNLPRIFLRTDINLDNRSRSGYLRRGEYAVTLTYQGTDKRSYYDAYLENFITPVYEAKVDGVSVAKVWKNSPEYLKDKRVDKVMENASITHTSYGIRFDLGSIESLSRLELNYDQAGCVRITSSYLQLSEDGRNWERLPGVLPDDWRISYLGEQPQSGKFIEPFVGQNARYIDISIAPVDACLYQVNNFKIFIFSDRI